MMELPKLGAVRRRQNKTVVSRRGARCVCARIALCMGLMGAPVGGAQAVSLTLACLDVGSAVAACREGAQRFAAATGHTVRVVAAQSNGRVALESYQALFDVESPRLDVVQFPDAWFYAMVGNLMPMVVTTEGEQVSAADGLGKVGDLRVALPHHLAINLVFVRRDVVNEGPASWEDLRRALLDAPTDAPTGIAVAGVGAGLFPYVVDWLFSFGITSLTDREPLELALTALEASVGEVVSPDVAEVDARGAMADFVDGRRAAMLARSTNLEEIAGSEVGERVGAVLRPGNAGAEGPTPILATVWYLGVSRHSRHKTPATELANFLASAEAQRENATRFDLLPTLAALYGEDALREEWPLIATLAARLDELRGAPVARYGSGYLDLSDGVSESVRALIRGATSAAEAAQTVVATARRARQRGGGE